MRRRGQMGIAMLILLTFMSYSFVSYMLGWDAPLFISLYNCWAGNVGVGCQGISSSASIFSLIVGLAVVIGLLGFGTSSFQFPNPYFYFLAIALAIAAYGFSIPASLFNAASGLPTGIRYFLIILFTFTETMAAVSWLKGGSPA